MKAQTLDELLYRLLRDGPAQRDVNEILGIKPFDGAAYDPKKGIFLGNPKTFHGTTPPHYLAFLVGLFDAVAQAIGYHRPAFLDLGSGIGEVVIYAAHRGLNAYGIDFDEAHHQEAVRKIGIATKTGFTGHGNAKVACGSFFPESFKAERILNNPEEDMYADEHQSPEHRKRDCYPELGIGLGQVDLFYHYQAERVQNILRLMSEYAKTRSILALLRVWQDSFQIPPDIRELGHFRRMHIYQKI